MNRVTDQTRNDVWYSMLDTDRLGRYYQALADRNQRFAIAIKVTLAASAMAGIIALLDVLPDWVQIVAGVLIAVAVVLDLAINHQRKAAILHGISTDLRPIAVEWSDLWGRTERMDEDAARERVRELSNLLNTITARAAEVGVGEDRHLNEKCAKETYQVFTDEYGLTSTS